jgi:hypothetical protein
MKIREKTLCCHDHNSSATQMPIPTLVGHLTPSKAVNALIDPGCLQICLFDQRLANRLVTQGAVRRRFSASAVLGFGRVKQEETLAWIMELVVEFRNKKRISIRAAELDHADFEFIIGAPSIQYFDLLLILHSHLKSLPPLCEICSTYDPQQQRNRRS